MFKPEQAVEEMKVLWESITKDLRTKTVYSGDEGDLTESYLKHPKLWTRFMPDGFFVYTLVRSQILDQREYDSAKVSFIAQKSYNKRYGDDVFDMSEFRTFVAHAISKPPDNFDTDFYTYAPQGLVDRFPISYRRMRTMQRFLRAYDSLVPLYYGHGLQESVMEVLGFMAELDEDKFVQNFEYGNELWRPIQRYTIAQGQLAFAEELRARDLSALVQTERVPLSALPEDAVNLVGSFLSGIEGPIRSYTKYGTSEVVPGQLEQLKMKRNTASMRGGRRRV